MTDISDFHEGESGDSLDKFMPSDRRRSDKVSSFSSVRVSLRPTCDSSLVPFFVNCCSGPSTHPSCWAYENSFSVSGRVSVDNGSVNGGDRGFSGDDLRSSRRITRGESRMPNLPSAASAPTVKNNEGGGGRPMLRVIGNGWE
jgi:hypothetical protein